MTKLLQRILNIGIALSAQRDMPKLLDTILNEAMEITHCDAGTLYLLEDNKLYFKIMRNNSMGICKGADGEEVGLPPVPLKEANVCAYSVIHRSMENIEDVYHSSRFDFSGPKNYDKLTGYRTQSMLVIPLENNKGEVTGVLQLINALDGAGCVIPFGKDFEPIFCSIASQAAIAVTNMRYMQENRQLFQSLVEVLAAAIDERSPYNSNHTKNVAALVTGFVDYIRTRQKDNDCGIIIDEELDRQVIMAAWLHDVGKIITPIEIMDKATRLGAAEGLVSLRWKLIFTGEQNLFLQGKITKDQWDTTQEEIEKAKELCKKANSGAPTLPAEMEEILSYTKRHTTLPDGEQIQWLTAGEAECLAIRYGTLTDSERKIMENHVVITRRLLCKIKFSKEYQDVPLFAATHHEKLNGRGYPNGLTAEELPLCTRILTIMDIFEALTAKDRPYKKSMTAEKAIDILDKMAAEGEIDSVLLELLKDWQRHLGNLC